jgi:hypothetical protein
LVDPPGKRDPPAFFFNVAIEKHPRIIPSYKPTFIDDFPATFD